MDVYEESSYSFSYLLVNWLKVTLSIHIKFQVRLGYLEFLPQTKQQISHIHKA